MRNIFKIFLFLSISVTICLSDVDQPVVLIAYHSLSGNTEKMAEAVHLGAVSVEGVTVKLLKIEDVQKEDILEAAAIIVGSPVHNANMTPAVQRFINNWPFKGKVMKDKIGAAFVTAGGISAGEELVQTNILHSMLIFGMIVVGGPEWTSAFGASAVVDEEPFNQPNQAGKISEQFLVKGKALGSRVAEITLKMTK